MKSKTQMSELSFFKSQASSMSKKRAGIGAIINNAVNICQYHVNKFNNYDIYIKQRELETLFIFNQKYPVDLYTYDIEKDYIANLIPNPSNAHDIVSMELVKAKRLVFESIFKFKNLEKLVLKAEEFAGKKTLGIQLRGTDKSGEITLPSLTDIFQKIETYLDRFDINNIYLATDDSYYLEGLSKRYKRILNADLTHKISKNGKPIHLRLSRKKINYQMVEDAYVLSKCPYFLYSHSNVSYFALTLGAGDFNKVGHTSLT